MADETGNMRGMPKLTTQQTLVILGAFATVGVLAFLKVELTTFLAFAAVVLAGAGVASSVTAKNEVQRDVQVVKEQTNGTNTRLVDALLADRAVTQKALMLALAHVPPEHAGAIIDALQGDSGIWSVPAPRQPMDAEPVGSGV